MKSPRPACRLVALLAIGAGVLAMPAVAAPPAATLADQANQQAVVELLDRMPLLFVPEQVSADGAMGFAVRGREASVWLGNRGLAYRLQGAGESESKATPGSWVLALDLVGATPRQPVGEDPLPTKVSYFKGPRDQWRTGLPSYGSVRYREPWPGVDVVVSGTAGELKSTFVLRPGADPSAIRLAYRGASAVRLETDGSLVVDTPLGSITEKTPIAYQEIDGRRVRVAAAFELEEGTEPGRQAYRFHLGEYDPGRELVVDPVTLVYCGYIGGAGIDSGTDIAVDITGNAYITGYTNSTGATFPVTVGPEVSYSGGDSDVFVARIIAAGTALDYCGYIGGSGSDQGHAIAVDAAGNAYVTGSTDSSEASFPVMVGPDLTHNGLIDAFVTKVNAAGTTLEYCGYIGGSDGDFVNGIAVDSSGNAYVTGRTESSEATFPVMVGPDLTYNGGDYDAFVAKVNAAGSALDYCGYIGGSDWDEGLGIAVDASRSAYVTGLTDSSETTFPVTVGPGLSEGFAGDAFVAKVNATGTALDYCGYIGGLDSESSYGVAVDSAGNAYITGSTRSSGATFPVTVGPDLSYNGGEEDAFIAKVSSPDAANRFVSLIPAAAVAAGAQGAFFQTDVEVNNTGAHEAQLTFQWLPRGEDNSEPAESEPIALAPGQSLRYENVLTELFGLEPDSVGALKLVASTDSVIGMSRTYNVPGAKIAGTFGQGLPAIPSDQLIPSAQVKRLIFMSENSDTRANVGCVNGLDTPVQITLELFDSAGTLLAVKTMNLGPWSNNQINRIFGDYAPVNGYVDVSTQTEGAAFYCYGSVLDNLTSDPTTVLPQTTSGATLFIPAVALAAGLEGAFFQTDVDLNNAGGTPAQYELGWLPRGADNSDPTMSDPFTLAAGASVRYENVLAEVFGLEPDQVGALVMEADSEDLLAMSLTYNLPSAKVAGTFGQELPGIPADQMIPTGVKKRIIFMNENDDVRSNVGCQNAGLSPVTVKIELHNADGERLGTRTMDLPPLSNDQATRVFRNHAPISAGYVDVWTDTEGASIYCYGSVLDNLTSDPTTVLPQ